MVDKVTTVPKARLGKRIGKLNGTLSQRYRRAREWLNTPNQKMLSD
jgi:mRNA-degrading endonuclease toxin of MazEF toxin-antitoxin module